MQEELQRKEQRVSQTTLYCYFNPTLPLIIFDKSILRQMV